MLLVVLYQTKSFPSTKRLVLLNHVKERLNVFMQNELPSKRSENVDIFAAGYRALIEEIPKPPTELVTPGSQSSPGLNGRSLIESQVQLLRLEATVEQLGVDKARLVQEKVASEE